MFRWLLNILKGRASRISLSCTNQYGVIQKETAFPSVLGIFHHHEDELRRNQEPRLLHVHLLVLDIGEISWEGYASVMALLANNTSLQLHLKYPSNKCLQENSFHKDEFWIVVGWLTCLLDHWLGRGQHYQQHKFAREWHPVLQAHGQVCLAQQLPPQLSESLHLYTGGHRPFSPCLWKSCDASFDDHQAGSGEIFCSPWIIARGSWVSPLSPQFCLWLPAWPASWASPRAWLRSLMSIPKHCLSSKTCKTGPQVHRSPDTERGLHTQSCVCRTHKIQQIMPSYAREKAQGINTMSLEWGCGCCPSKGLGPESTQSRDYESKRYIRPHNE